MFARQTEIVQLLLLCCIVIQCCLLHDVGSSLAPLKTESEPLSEDATTDGEDHYGRSWTTDILPSRSSGCRPRCRRETSSSSKDQEANTVEYILRRREGRSVESDNQKRDYAQGEISGATNEWDEASKRRRFSAKLDKVISALTYINDTIDSDKIIRKLIKLNNTINFTNNFTRDDIDIVESDFDLRPTNRPIES